jgi:hypothetical protein
MSDIQGLVQQLIEFRDEREGCNSITPKDLALAINVEAGSSSSSFYEKMSRTPIQKR